MGALNCTTMREHPTFKVREKKNEIIKSLTHTFGNLKVEKQIFFFRDMTIALEIGERRMRC